MTYKEISPVFIKSLFATCVFPFLNFPCHKYVCLHAHYKDLDRCGFTTTKCAGYDWKIIATTISINMLRHCK